MSSLSSTFEPLMWNVKWYENDKAERHYIYDKLTRSGSTKTTTKPEQYAGMLIFIPHITSYIFIFQFNNLMQPQYNYYYN